MAFYKQPCIHCGALIDADSNFCAGCGSRSPFGYNCPTCGRPIEKNMALCPGCGRSLRVACPVCGAPTFVQDICEICGASLLVRCANPRCGAWQFFENEKCTACGKKIKKAKK